MQVSAVAAIFLCLSNGIGLANDTVNSDGLPTSIEVPAAPPIDLGVNEAVGISVSQTRIKLDRDTDWLTNIVSWPYTMPRISRGADILEFRLSAPDRTTIRLTWDTGGYAVNPMRLPQCLPNIPDWTPAYVSQSPVLVGSGIWQRRVGSATHRAVIIFDGRCDETNQGGQRYLVLVSGPILWRFVEVRQGFHEGPSVAMSSEMDADGVMTLAVSDLPSSALDLVYPERVAAQDRGRRR